MLITWLSVLYKRKNVVYKHESILKKFHALVFIYKPTKVKALDEEFNVKVNLITYFKYEDDNHSKVTREEPTIDVNTWVVES